MSRKQQRLEFVHRNGKIEAGLSRDHRRDEPHEVAILVYQWSSGTSMAARCLSLHDRRLKSVFSRFPDEVGPNLTDHAFRIRPIRSLRMPNRKYVLPHSNTLWVFKRNKFEEGEVHRLGLAHRAH